MQPKRILIGELKGKKLNIAKKLPFTSTYTDSRLIHKIVQLGYKETHFCSSYNK